MNLLDCAVPDPGEAPALFPRPVRQQCTCGSKIFVITRLHDDYTVECSACESAVTL